MKAVNEEVNIIATRLANLESQLPHNSFDPEVSFSVANLPMVGDTENYVDLMNEIQHLIYVGMELADIEVVAVARMTAKGRQPGRVLVEVRNAKDRDRILRARRILRHNPVYSSLKIRRQGS